MGKKRTTEILVETKLVTTIRRWTSVHAYCVACDANVKMIVPDQAAAAAGMSITAIYAKLESGDFHFIESSNGQIRICLASVLKSSIRFGESKQLPEPPH